MKKRLALICCIISCILVMAGCSFSLVKTNENFDEKVLEENTDSFVKSWFEYDFDSAVSDYADQLDSPTPARMYSTSRVQTATSTALVFTPPRWARA